MASRSISAVRTWARNPGVGVANRCDSCGRSTLSGGFPARWLLDFPEASPSPGSSWRWPEPLGFSSLLMARYPYVLSVLYSNAEPILGITRQGHDERHFRALRPMNRAESMTSEDTTFNQPNYEPHSLTACGRTEHSLFYFSPGERGNTVWRGSGMAMSPLAACQRIAFSTSVSAASATEKSSAEDSFAPRAVLVLAW